jgi:hypothetical protein
MTRIRNRPEEALQRSVAQYLDIALPEDAEWFAISNGFKRSKAEAGVAKAMGQKAGVPDVEIIHRGRAIFIELKAPGRKLSERQHETTRSLVKAGAYVAMCSSLSEVEEYLSAFMPLRGKVAA